MRPRVSATIVASLLVLLAGVIGLQAARDERTTLAAVGDGEQPALYVQSGTIAKRMALSYDALAADVYWMRALQHFGRTKLSKDPNKQYDLLFPLLDLTTTLDPDFEIAYRFGAVFLGEAFPSGAGRPDLAIALLEKGMKAHPTNWQYPQDIAFVHYWWRRDFVSAADWFRRAARLPNAPAWLEPMAAVSLTEGGNRASARQLWMQVLTQSDADWLRDQARIRLVQLDALDQIDALEQVVENYQQLRGQLPSSWQQVVGTGLLARVPLDPAGYPYQLNQYWGTVTVAPESSVGPLPEGTRRRR